jgi:hypothetical protein
MWTWLKRLFETPPSPQFASPPTPYWTPERVEALIDAAGRAEVFERARVLGWTYDNPPPLWVWAHIAAEVSDARPTPVATIH